MSAAWHILARARYTSTSIFLLLLLFLLLDLLLSLFGFGLGLTLVFDALKISFILLKPLLSFLFGCWNWLRPGVSVMGCRGVMTEIQVIVWHNFWSVRENGMNRITNDRLGVRVWSFCVQIVGRGPLCRVVILWITISDGYIVIVVVRLLF